MRIVDCFSVAMIVSVPTRKDRRRDMRRMLAGIGWPLRPGRLEFFDGIRPDGPGPFESVGAHGAFLSHLTVLRGAHRAGAERVLVMEDDLELDPRLPEREDTIARSLLSRPWGMVYLGHFADHLPRSPDGLVPWDGATRGAHCYGVAQPALGPLVAYLEAVLTRPAGHPDGGAMHVDGAFHMFRQREGIHTLFASPNLGWQRRSRSDVAPRLWFDQWPIAQRAATMARRVLNWIELRRSSSPG
jgi:glycosyl transferase family 25